MLKTLRKLSNLKRITGGAAFILAGIAVAGAFISPKPASPTPPHTTVFNEQQSGQVKGDSTFTPDKPTLSMQTVTETEAIPYQSTTQGDSNLPAGQKKILTQGANGVETYTYAVTYTNGQQTSKILLSKVVTTPPVNQVVAIGSATSTSDDTQTVQDQQCQSLQNTPENLTIRIHPITAINKTGSFVEITTVPCADLTLTITYCNGDQATSLSLYQPVRAYLSGNYIWPWVPDTRCHTALADATASWQGQSVESKLAFTIQQGNSSTN